MASTGLLGINPYQKGVSLDFSSKPIALAIQLEQKEAAKRDALDKYFMDYEKTIDPSVMRSQDRNVVLNKLNQNKQFYLQNRDKILNPTKYGAEFQSQYLANYKDIMSDIAKSKQAGQNDNLVVRQWMSQKGLNPPKGYDEALAKSHLPIDQGYEPLDVTKYSFYKTFDPNEYTNKLKGFSRPGLPIQVKDVSGNWYGKKTYQVQPGDTGKVMLIGMTDYENKNNQGFINFIDEKFNDGFTVQQLQQKYPNIPIKTPRDLAGIFAVDFVPVKEETSVIHAPRLGRTGGKGGSSANATDISGTILSSIWNNGTDATRQIDGQEIKGRVVKLPEDIKNMGNRKIGSSTFTPDEYFMDENGTAYPIFSKGKPTKSSEGIPQYNIRLELGKGYGSSKGALNFSKTNTGGGASGGTKKKSGAAGLN
jgi:hypothetical protein